MIKPEHIEEAKRIGNDSWILNQFLDLPKDASKKEQIKALQSEAQWMRDHIQSICSQIDRLCDKIEEGKK